MSKGGSGNWSGSVFDSTPVRNDTYTHMTYDEKNDTSRFVDSSGREYVGNENYTKEGKNEYSRTGSNTHSHYRNGTKVHDYRLRLEQLKKTLETIKQAYANDYVRRSQELAQQELYSDEFIKSL